MSLLILIGTVLVLEFILRSQPASMPRNVAPDLGVPDLAAADVTAADVTETGDLASIRGQLLDVAKALENEGRGTAPALEPDAATIDRTAPVAITHRN